MEPLRIEVELKVDERLIGAINALAEALASSPKAKSAPRKAKEPSAAVEPRKGVQTRAEAPIVNVPTDETPSAITKAEDEEWNPTVIDAREAVREAKILNPEKDIDEACRAIIKSLGYAKLSDLSVEERRTFITKVREL